MEDRKEMHKDDVNNQNNHTGARAAEDVPIGLFRPSHPKEKPSVDMREVVGKKDILFICLDTLRYDVAVQEEKAGTTPVLNQYGPWEKCQAPGNFTYPSHHAMFAGFMPCRYDAKNVADRELLFFPRQIGLGNKVPEGAYGFSGSTIMEGLAADGYDTWCVGGVAFFDKRSPIGKVFPGYFKKSYWNPSFACPVKESTKNQVDFLLKKFRRQIRISGSFCTLMWMPSIIRIIFMPTAFLMTTSRAMRQPCAMWIGNLDACLRDGRARGRKPWLSAARIMEPATARTAVSSTELIILMSIRFPISIFSCEN